jgi:hypothetical protein
MRKGTFVVGRTMGRSTVLVLVTTTTKSPIAGPWTVQAVVSTN